MLSHHSLLPLLPQAPLLLQPPSRPERPLRPQYKQPVLLVPPVSLPKPNNKKSKEPSPRRDGKCDRRGCLIPSDRTPPVKCCIRGCSALIHLECYKKLLRDQQLEPLPDGNIACSKKCHFRYIKISTTGLRPGWDNDGHGGWHDPLTSGKILLDWLLKDDNYSRYKVKASKGATKLSYAKDLANEMNRAKVRVYRDAKQVINKITHIEQRFIRAHEVATAASVDEDNETGRESTRDEIERICQNYFALLPVMADQLATKQRKASNHEISDNEANLDNEPTDCARSGSESDTPTTATNNIVLDKAICDEVQDPVEKETKHEMSDIEEIEERLTHDLNENGVLGYESDTPTDATNNMISDEANHDEVQRLGKKRGLSVDSSVVLERHRNSGGAIVLSSSAEKKLTAIYDTKRQLLEMQTRDSQIEFKLNNVKRLIDLRRTCPTLKKEEILSLFPDFADIIDTIMR